MSVTWPRGLLLSVLLLVIAALPAWSQDALEVDRFTVALWPEYDRPDVLVTYRVELSPSVTLPAQVDLPIPADVGIPHAIAKLGADGVLYNAPATREVEGEWAVMRVTTDSPRIQLEYYAPLSVSADARNFDFQWRGGLDINFFDYEVLSPRSAVDLAVTPRPSREVTSDIGVPLQLGALGPQAAAQQVAIAITYRNPGGRLTMAPAPPPSGVVPPPLISSSDQRPAAAPSTAQTPAPPPAAPASRAGRFLLIALGIAIVALVVLGFVQANRKRSP